MASFNLQWRTSTKKDLRKIPREMVSRSIDPCLTSLATRVRRAN